VTDSSALSRLLSDGLTRFEAFKSVATFEG